VRTAAARAHCSGCWPAPSSRTDGTIRLLQRRLDDIVAAREPAPPPPLAFDLPAAADDTPNPLLQASELTLSGRVTLRAGADLELSAGDRLLVRGRNGAGKSSLLAMLAGDLRPDSGALVVAPGARAGLLGQEDDLDPHKTPP
jgi:macrolide transport system ATP-binding/permease protein